jgi:hypothetical protein
MAGGHVKNSKFSSKDTSSNISANNTSSNVAVDTTDSPSTLPFNSSIIKGKKRIGPHHQDIISIIFGSLLGDGHMVQEKEGSRMMFYQSGDHGEYLLWLHSKLVE